MQAIRCCLISEPRSPHLFLGPTVKDEASHRVERLIQARMPRAALDHVETFHTSVGQSQTLRKHSVDRYNPSHRKAS